MISGAAMVPMSKLAFTRLTTASAARSGQRRAVKQLTRPYHDERGDPHRRQADSGPVLVVHLGLGWESELRLLSLSWDGVRVN
ncbi:MAG: hypothetical protein ACK4GC_04295 [Paracoccaceae bacterium]